MKEMQKALTPQEKWERATIANNFIFYKVMRNNPDICKELLEILLEFQAATTLPSALEALSRTPSATRNGGSSLWNGTERWPTCGPKAERKAAKKARKKKPWNAPAN